MQAWDVELEVGVLLDDVTNSTYEHFCFPVAIISFHYT